MTYEETMKEAFPDVDPGIQPFGSRVLVQIRTAKTKTSGGIILTTDTTDTEKWNTKICIKTKFASVKKIPNHPILSFLFDFQFLIFPFQFLASQRSLGHLYLKDNQLLYLLILFDYFFRQCT